MQGIKLSISDKALIGMDPFDSLHHLSEHGFTHIHFSHKWQSTDPLSRDELERLQSNLVAANLEVLDVHGMQLSIAAEDAQERQLAFDMFRHRLETTHILGGDAMVYHVPEREFSDTLLARYIDGLQRLEEDARNRDIIIALENHYKKENDRRTLSACFEKFDPSYIGFTFDPGHASISSNLTWLLENCMDRLTILHLNDNDGVQDKHWLPFDFEGIVDWDAVVQGIVKSPYHKPVQLEVAWRQDKHASCSEFLDAAAKAAREFHGKIGDLRTMN
jgi:sugar phosphate isomerase/epimerase